MANLTIQNAFELALNHHKAGRFGEAEQLYRYLIERQPAHVDAIHLLGIVAHQTKRYHLAVELFRRAIALRPGYPEGHNNLATALKELGRLDDAIMSYRQAVGFRPDFAEAWCNLAGALKDKGEYGPAIDASRHAIKLRPNYAEAYGILGAALQRLGKLAESLEACQRAIDLDPNLPDGQNNLGAALGQSGRVDDAIAAFRKAIALRPTHASAHANLGLALDSKSDIEGAIASFRRALELQIGSAEIHSLLGSALGKTGRLDEAIGEFRKAILLRPDYAVAYSNLGAALRDPDQIEEALACCRRAIELRPAFPEAYSNLGQALKAIGQVDQAIVAFRHAIDLRPHFPDAYCNLGIALRDMGKLEEALAACRKAVALAPDMADAHNNLGLVLSNAGKLDEAIAALVRAISLDPQLSAAHNNLASALKDAGRLDEALQSWRMALSNSAEPHAVHSNLIYALHLHPDSTPTTIANECRRYNELYAKRLQASTAYLNERSTHRRLRIGYVSPDLRNHVVGRNMLPLFRNHDRQRFEIFCYSTAGGRDELTGEFQSHADLWQNIAEFSDERAATLINTDRVDILVDLSVHTANNRLLIFARKPAPIQVTFAGYPGSTGLTSIDYRFSDPFLDPDGIDESLYSERTIRLPHSFWCYDPFDSRDILPNGLPALQSGVITFGCFNNFAKVNDASVKLWARVLASVTDSRLVLLAPQGSHRRRITDEFASLSIEPSRIQFVDPQPHRGYLNLYHRIDLSLDTFPYNGHTTALDSLWMGVPMVTLFGRTPVSRAGWSQLSNLNFPELSARTPDEFVDIAMRLATDFPRLANLRSTLRERMEKSPIMNSAGFTRGIEAAYHDMWKRWCGWGE